MAGTEEGFVSENEGFTRERPSESEPEEGPPPGEAPPPPEPVSAPAEAPTASLVTSEAAPETAGELPPRARYPVNVSFVVDDQDRWWGIPLVGVIIRSILVIPQAIVLAVLAIAVWFVMLVSWIPILVNGRQASWAYTVVGGYIRLSTRVAGYVLLLTGRYPPFGPGGEHTIEVTFDESETQNRLWGIPFVGIWVRAILLIPHWIILWLLGIVVAFMFLVSWIPILAGGRQADWVMQWVGGFYRWGDRVIAYQLLLTGKYPPFRLDP